MPIDGNMSRHNQGHGSTMDIAAGVPPLPAATNSREPAHRNQQRFIERRQNGTFLPGVSGNPRGRPRAFDETTELCREHTPAAIATLVSIATSGKSEAARVAAACALLDRGYGRPPQAVEAVLRSRNSIEELSARKIENCVGQHLDPLVSYHRVIHSTGGHRNAAPKQGAPVHQSIAGGVIDGRPLPSIARCAHDLLPDRIS
jgi:hypothetical protein